MNAAPVNAVLESLSGLLAQIRNAQAANLARRGKYDEAIRMLRGSGQEELSVDALDLQARIAAQQGRLLVAEGLWTDVLRTDSGHAGARQGLERIRKINRYRVRFLGLSLSAVIIVCAILGFAVLAVAGFTYSLVGLKEELRMNLGVLAASQREQVLQIEELSGSLRKIGISQDNHVQEVRMVNDALREQAAAQQEMVKRMDEFAVAVNRSLTSSQQDVIGRLRIVESASVKQTSCQEQILADIDKLSVALGNSIVSTHQQSVGRLERVEAALEKHRNEQEALGLQMESVLGALKEQARSQEAVKQELANVGNRVAALSPAVRMPPMIDIEVPGVIASVDGDALMVSFEEDLFTVGTLCRKQSVLRREALQMLKAVALALKPHAEEVRIAVIGCSLGEGRSEYVESLRRAEAVMDFLRVHACVSPTKLSLQGIGMSDGSFFEEHFCRMGRSTVMLVIHRRGRREAGLLDDPG